MVFDRLFHEYSYFFQPILIFFTFASFLKIFLNHHLNDNKYALEIYQ